ncbi:MAG: DUF975 family protein [Lachnospiraceae bacterium]|nr:DUF975 family protein [Lachnospiraceae bacterium]
MTKRSLSRIRTDSRDALAGNYSVCFIALFFMFIADVAATQIMYLLPLRGAPGVFVILTDVLYSIPGALILTMLQAGFLFLCLNIARYGHPTFNDTLLAFRYDPSKAVGLCLVIGLIDIICSLPLSYALTDLMIDSLSAFQGGTLSSLLRSIGYVLAGALFTMVLRVIFAYPFSQALMLYIDHQEYSGTECLMKSRELMRGQIIRYLTLEVSFLGYLALAILSLGVGLIWVIPYINVSRANFYMDLTGTYKPY